MVVLGIVLLGSGAPDAGRGRTVVIKSLKGETQVQGLEADVHLEVEGVIGTSTLAIGPDGVAFLDSPCPHKLCVARGRIKLTGEWVLCLPNGVMAEITGEGEYDGITP